MAENAAEKQADRREIQQLIRRNVLMFSSLGALAAGIVYYIFPVGLLPESLASPAGRLVFTVQWNVLPVVILFALFAHIGNTRFCSRQVNPLQAEDHEKVEVHCRVLQNTLEQFVMSFTAQLATSTWLDRTQMSIIPIVVMLFVCGRLLFWHGYLDPSYCHANRSRGLGMSAYPTLAMLVFSIYKLVVH